MNRLFRSKKTRYRNLVLIILPIFILCGVFGYVTYASTKTLLPEDDTVSYKDSIDSMDYHLRWNATELQIEYFNELQDLINAEGTEHKDIAACVAKNYIADFYTWSNKRGSYDVGGMYYVYSPQKLGIISDCRNNYYKYLSYYINKFGQDKMLEVTSVETVVGDVGTYEIDGNKYESYRVTCNWTYKNAETFSDLDIVVYNPEMVNLDSFITKIHLNIIINNDGRYEIVEAYGDI